MDMALKIFFYSHIMRSLKMFYHVYCLHAVKEAINGERERGFSYRDDNGADLQNEYNYHREKLEQLNGGRG